MTNYGVVVGGSPGAAIAGLKRGESTLDNRPNLAEPYTWVETGDPEFDTDASPPWQNGWTFLDTDYVGFRHGLDGLLEFIGTVDASGATTGTVAFTVGVRWRPDQAFSFLTDLDQGAGAFSAARVVVATNGEVTIYFPLT